MKQLHPLLLLLLVSGVIFSCGPTLKVTSDYDHRIDFSRYKTFALFRAGSSPTISPLNQARIINSIKNEMKGKGFKEDTVSPDILVNSVAIVRNEAEVSASTNYYGYGGLARPYYWGPGMTTAYTTYSVENYKAGSLIIDIMDATTKKLLWQGAGNSKIDQPVDNPDVQIGKAIDKIMAEFPPGNTNK